MSSIAKNSPPPSIPSHPHGASAAAADSAAAAGHEPPELSARSAALAGLVASAAPRQQRGVAARSAAAGSQALHALSHHARSALMEEVDAEGGEQDFDGVFDDADLQHESRAPRSPLTLTPQRPVMQPQVAGQDDGDEGGPAGGTLGDDGGGQGGAAAGAAGQRTAQGQNGGQAADDKRGVSAIEDTARIAAVSRTTRTVRRGARPKGSMFRPVAWGIALGAAIVLGSAIWLLIRPPQDGGGPQNQAQCSGNDPKRCGR
jgi:hypothetical protein